MPDTLFEPAQLGPMALKNRAVRSATNEHLAQSDGQFTTAWADTLEELAQGEVGLIITGHLSVERTQRADEGQPVLDAAADPALLQRAAQGVHRYGGRLVAQISHSGPKASAAVNGRAPYSCGNFTADGLSRLIDSFRLAARLLQQAGWDGVQIHCAHGYLLSCFLNPACNTRTDVYGGDLAARFRLVAEIIAAVRAACGPGFAILVKADSQGGGALPALLRLFQGAGVDGIELSGLDFSARAGEKSPFYLETLLQARSQLEVPLWLVGGVFSRREADRVLRAGIPFVSFSRALICEPDFIAKLKAGQTNSRCLACNGCYHVYRRRPVRCVQHTRPIPQLEQVFHHKRSNTIG